MKTKYNINGEMYNNINCEFVEAFDEYELYIHTPTGNKISVPLIPHNTYWVVTRDWANAEIII